MKKIIEDTEEELKLTADRFMLFFRWLLVSFAIGVTGGIIGTAFYKSIAWANAVRAARAWLVYLLPAGGLIIALIYKVAKNEKRNTNTVITSILAGENIPVSLTPVIFVSTVITHLFGGSAGREGAALQIGGSIGCNMGKLFRLDEKEERVAILSGMSAVFSALFGTPTTAVIFALEVCSVGIIHYSGLIPCGIAAITAFAITKLFGIVPTHFALAAVSLDYFMIIQVAVLSALIALLSSVFCHIMHVTYKSSEDIIHNPFLRIAAGGALLALLTFIVGNQDYNGGGVNIIERAIVEGEAEPFAFLLKIIFTAITLGCGFKGGEIVPTFFIGATFGCVVGPMIGIPPQLSAAIGFVGMFCGAVNCPLASLVLSIEVFGADNLIYFATACFVTYMLSGYTGLYSEQKIMYSKFKAEFINRKTE